MRSCLKRNAHERATVVARLNVFVTPEPARFSRTLSVWDTSPQLRTRKSTRSWTNTGRPCRTRRWRTRPSRTTSTSHMPSCAGRAVSLSPAPPSGAHCVSHEKSSYRAFGGFRFRSQSSIAATIAASSAGPITTTTTLCGSAGSSALIVQSAGVGPGKEDHRESKRSLPGPISGGFVGAAKDVDRVRDAVGTAYGKRRDRARPQRCRKAGDTTGAIPPLVINAVDTARCPSTWQWWHAWVTGDNPAPVCVRLSVSCDP